MIKPSSSVVLFLAMQGIRRHAFSSFVAILSISMSAGLLLSTWKLGEESKHTFTNSTGGFDAVLGARGSEVQIILNSLFHLESSPGNISWEQYEIIKTGDGVREAYPIAVGDNYKGFRIVGTLPALFENHEWKKGSQYLVRQGGRIFSDKAKEALVGAFVAKKLGLKVGDKFHPYHGLDYDEASKHPDVFVVVGVLEATGTPADRVIWIPIRGVQMMEGHDPAMANSISAVLLNIKPASQGVILYNRYNRQGNVATLAWPVTRTLNSFFDKFNWFHKVLELVSLMIALVGSLIIALTLNNSMHERKREFAILRCLGASRRVVAGIVIGQSLILSFGGCIAGLLFHFVINYASMWIIHQNTGVLFEVFSLNISSLYVMGSILVIGLLSGAMPAIYAYKSELSKNLNPIS